MANCLDGIVVSTKEYVAVFWGVVGSHQCRLYEENEQDNSLGVLQ